MWAIGKAEFLLPSTHSSIFHHKVQNNRHITSPTYPLFAHYLHNSCIHTITKPINRCLTKMITDKKMPTCVATALQLAHPVKSKKKANYPNTIKKIKIFTAKKSSHAPSATRPKNTQELLESFIMYGRGRIKAKDDLLSSDDFTLTPNDPSIINAMTTKESAKEWIHQNIIQPGLAIANLTLTASQKTNYINSLKAQVIAKELHVPFRVELKKIDPKTNNVYEFSNKMMDLIQSLTEMKSESARSTLTAGVSAVLIENVLPASAKEILSNTCARIANTHITDHEGKCTYLACYFNPVTKALDLGSISEDGNNLHPQDQHECLYYIPWELYGLKISPKLQGHKITQV